MTTMTAKPPTKKDTVAFYREKLSTDARWALKGLMRIYELQTPTEQEYEVTAYHNGVGFTGVDAKLLTSFAKQYEWRGSLSDKQMELLFKKIPKYAAQLYRLRNQEIEIGAAA